MKIQKQGIKTVSELIADGATAADLPQDTQVYITANSLNKTLNQAITDGDLSQLKLFAKYYCSVNKASSSTQPIDFDTAIYSHASVTTGSGWKFTVPSGYAGYYLIKTSMATQTSALNTEMYYNGSSIGWGMQTVNNTEFQTGMHLVFLNVSDYIDIRLVGGSDNILGGANPYTTIDIIYLG